MQSAIVTGASRGLGRALSRELASTGWRLVIDARSASPLEAVARELAGSAREVTALAGDITDPGHRGELVRAAGQQLDLLVLNASDLGQTPLPPLARYRLEDLRAVLEVNLVAQLGLLQVALPALRAGAGRVLALSSDAAVEGYPGWGGYGASKAGLDQLTRVLAAEEPALRVYAVDPGDMRTAMQAAAFPGEDISDRAEPESVLPALRRLIDGDLPSGRYLASQLVPAGPGAPAAAEPQIGAGR